uniref:Retrotransposon Gag domain-containing protein n=1 Tax=Tanacetum cinerariifolium TaxID=118510 RepID=A0A699H7L0_TANCI|nr:retrotransposon Gag domain-containing protein [Tanacetum cinerariifolium]
MERKERGRRSQSQASLRFASVFSRLGAKRQDQRRTDMRELIQRYANCLSERQLENEREYRRHEWEDSSDEPLESKDNDSGRHWKRQSRRAKRKQGTTCPSPMMRSLPPLSLKESISLCSRKEFECLPPSKHMTGGATIEAARFHKLHQEQSFERKEDFKRRPRDRRHDQITPLTKTPKEILAMKAKKGTFITPPPMSGALESRNKNKYCDFYKDKGHNTDDCLHLKR